MKSFIVYRGCKFIEKMDRRLDEIAQANINMKCYASSVWVFANSFTYCINNQDR